MKIACLTATRDRLEYTQHCFSSLNEFAGCEFDHFVYDNASSDGTDGWLMEGGAAYTGVILGKSNVGIARAINSLVALALWREYDVIVKFDNDCELTQPNTLRDVCDLVVAGNVLLSPRILGLNNPPRVIGEFDIAGELILDIPQIGGIFLAAPGAWYRTYRYPEDGPIWGMDDAHICREFRSGGGRCGYVKRLEAHHYETTSGQHARYPEYFERTLAEGKPSL